MKTNLILNAILALALFGTVAQADVELSIEGIQAHTDGGCFYVVARPDNNESVGSMNIALASDQISATDENINFQYDPLLQQTWHADPLFNQPGSSLPMQIFVWQGLGGAALTDSTPPGQAFIAAQVRYTLNGGADPSNVSVAFATEASHPAEAFALGGGTPETIADLHTLSLPANPTHFGTASTPFTVCQDYAIQAVPEPSSFLFLGLIGCSIFGWKKYRQFGLGKIESATNDK